MEVMFGMKMNSEINPALNEECLERLTDLISIRKQVKERIENKTLLR